MKESNVTFGFWLYLMSDCVLFGALFATYAVLQGAVFGGPVMSDIVSLPFVLTETVILLVSSTTVGFALLCARQHRRAASLALLGVTLLLGLAFLALEIQEFSHLVSVGEGPSESAFLSSFFALVGTHGLHVAVGCVWMLVVAAHILLRGTGQGTLTKLACLTLFWHFLDIIWVCIFTFVYLFGALALV